MRPRAFISHAIQLTLRSIGVRKLDHQFLLSYTLIFLCALGSASFLYFSTDAGEAKSLNVAGAQRMLSQRVAKEVQMVAAGVEERSQAQQTIDQWERAHDWLLKGSAEAGVPAVKDPAIRKQLNHVLTLWQDYRPALQAYMDDPDRSTLKQLHQMAPTVLSEMNKAVGMMSSLADRNTRFNQIMSISMVLAILLLVVLGRMFGLTYLMDQIHMLRLRLLALADGDFRQTMEHEFQDNEIAEIVAAYNTMRRQVGELVAGVRDVAKQIDESTEHATDVIHQAQKGVEQQQSDTDQVATAVNEMSATVQEVARNTSETAEASARADERAGSGQKTVSDAAKMVQALSGRMGELQQLTTRLQDESNEVGTVLSVITDIADQTNLLALNAAIEAARAGEAGRGFAVVADEVRGLAKRTQESIGKIDDIVNRFQSGTGEVAQAMHKGQEEAHQGADAMNEAEAALREIADTITSIRSMADQIATATEEQSQVADEIDQRVVKIAEVADHNTGQMTETVQATGTIQQQVHRLRGLVENLKV
ncbi:MAG: type IV pili methyl-accepting chemotaxis transducer N-terminal domain-containing protein [Alteromonadaceae bacterium]|nr:type IV pili methyl-accepting chemotaxis transducer N-terminal domain-containing protein [Alteromonadaceae bacterium]